MQAARNFLYCLQGLPAVARYYAELCSQVPTEKSLSERIQNKIWSASFQGLGACFTQICSDTALVYSSNGSADGVVQCWLLCAESMMGSCTELIKRSPACARAVIPLPGRQ